MVRVRRSKARKHVVIGYSFRFELTPFALDACCRLPKRKAACENFIVYVFVRYKNNSSPSANL